MEVRASPYLFGDMIQSPNIYGYNKFFLFIINRHLGYFHILTAMNDAVMNIHYKTFMYKCLYEHIFSVILSICISPFSCCYEDIPEIEFIKTRFN